MCQLHRVAATQRQHKDLHLFVHILRKVRQSIAVRRPPRRAHIQAIVSHHASLPGRNIDELDLTIPPVVFHVRTAHHNRDRLSIRGDLRIGYSDDLWQIVCREPARLSERRRKKRRE
jgi:hypothetical protein